MIQSQFNLEHRIAELRQVNDGRRSADAFDGDRQPIVNRAAGLAGAIRSFFGGQTRNRSTRIAVG